MTDALLTCQTCLSQLQSVLDSFFEEAWDVLFDAGSYHKEHQKDAEGIARSHNN